jgi:hypothetical protein
VRAPRAALANRPRLLLTAPPLVSEHNEVDYKLVEKKARDVVAQIPVTFEKILAAIKGEGPKNPPMQ